MKNITEIITDDMSVKYSDLMEKGQLFCGLDSRITELEDAIKEYVEYWDDFIVTLKEQRKGKRVMAYANSWHKKFKKLIG